MPLVEAPQCRPSTSGFTAALKTVSAASPFLSEHMSRRPSASTRTGLMSTGDRMARQATT